METTLLSDIGELELIRRICRKLPWRRDVLVGPGDDCAVVRVAGDRTHDLLLKSDPVIEQVHFTAQASGQAIGHKALGRALSDIAAMGGEPIWALVDLVAPGDVSVALVDRVFQGLLALAKRSGVAVVGGDVSAGPALEIHVFVVGRVAKGKAILRSGAKPGDSLFVTGSLGGSLAGRHLKFAPRLEQGRWLARQGWARAMIDLSDGLATDLRNLLQQSRAGAELRLAAIPISKAAQPRGRSQAEALRHALSDGEDFELLFAVPAAKTPAFIRAWQRRFKLPCTRIGTVTRQRGVIETVDVLGRRRCLAAGGYEHFRHQGRSNI